MYDTLEPASEHGLAGLLQPLLTLSREKTCPEGSFSALESTRVPQPYQRLLVHQADMTSTLARFFGEDICLRVLDSRREGDVYARRVLLVLGESGRIVEYGGIEIRLSLLPDEVSHLILQEIEPLGGILNRLGVSYHSQPRRYLKIVGNASLDKIFHQGKEAALFGRCNQLSTDRGDVFAKIVEILPVLEREEVVRS